MHDDKIKEIPRESCKKMTQLESTDSENDRPLRAIVQNINCVNENLKKKTKKKGKHHFGIRR